MASDKHVSVAELKTFIDAVEFASDADNWIPSQRQWERIRSMIDRLEDAPAPPPPARYVPDNQQMMQLPQPSMMQVPQGGMMPSMMQPPQMLPPNAPFAAGNPAMPVRTPDIDTMGKPYQSAFAA
jgi:hypothetical protein